MVDVFFGDDRDTSRMVFREEDQIMDLDEIAYYLAILSLIISIVVVVIAEYQRRGS